MSSVAERILRILERFSHQEQENFQGDAHHQTLEKINQHIASRSPIRLVLPAFPLKNPNMDKTLGRMPDLGEELALARLDRLCGEISQVYECGAQISVVSDGVVYGDLMGVADSDSFQYGQSLRSLASGKEFRHIAFLRVSDILDQKASIGAAVDAYLTAVPHLREQLETFLDPSFNVEHELDANVDTRLTYQSFVALLAKDMPWRDNFSMDLLQDKQRYDQEVGRLAKCMVRRLVAYENLLREKFPDHIRLSIHRSTGKEKVYIPLLPRGRDPGMNPWNCCVAVMENGHILTGYAKDFHEKFDLVEQDGRPYFFKARSAISSV